MIDFQRAKQTPIPDILHHYGLTGRQHGNNLFFYSPWRPETVRSFCVKIRQNTWIDYGDRSYGDAVALVSKIESCGMGEAANIILNGKSTYHQISLKPARESRIEILQLQKLAKPDLINYLCKRKIDLDIARLYTEEARIQYTGSGAIDRLIAFKNKKNGYEFRKEGFKVSNSPKYYSLIKGDSKKYCIFEGFFDFLSALTYFKEERLKESVIVLNSLSFLSEVLDGGILKGCDVVAFFDNDKAGDEAMDMFEDAGLVVNDNRWLYHEYNDFNDFLTGKKMLPIITQEEIYHFYKNII